MTGYHGREATARDYKGFLRGGVSRLPRRASRRAPGPSLSATEAAENLKPAVDARQEFERSMASLKKAVNRLTNWQRSQYQRAVAAHGSMTVEEKMAVALFCADQEKNR